MNTVSSTFSFFGLALVGTLGFSSMGEAKGGGKNVLFSLPIMSTNSSSTAHMEFNLGMHAGVALEASYIHAHERVGKDTTEETGEAMSVSGGRSFSAHIARYSDAARLSGFFWSLGMGYQTMDLRWAVPADESDPDVEMGLADEAGILSHHVTLNGVTGHGRVGYNYVGEDYPLMAGIYLGLNHFQSAAADYHEANNEEADVGVSNLTDAEKDRLKRRFKTSPALGISVGVAF